MMNAGHFRKSYVSSGDLNRPRESRGSQPSISLKHGRLAHVRSQFSLFRRSPTHKNLPLATFCTSEQKVRPCRDSTLRVLFDAFCVAKSIEKRPRLRRNLFSLNRLTGHLGAKPQFIGYQRNKFTVGRLAARTLYRVTEIRIDRVNVASVPCNFNRMTYGSLHTR